MNIRVPWVYLKPLHVLIRKYFTLYTFSAGISLDKIDFKTDYD